MVQRLTGAMLPTLSSLAIEHGTEMGCIFTGACATLACSWLKVDWRTNGETALALCSLVEAAILFVSSQSQVMWLAYFCYVMFVVVYYAMFTITNKRSAKQHSSLSFSRLPLEAEKVRTGFPRGTRSLTLPFSLADNIMSAPVPRRYPVCGDIGSMAPIAAPLNSAMLLSLDYKMDFYN
ncbi:unnamed protein product [Timema podura]|uniref:Uncharacterized protein n=1 Tax=Timema podura TaxID=61482 RepID=A0ABN7NSH6_TIMPD|nr:unnamed protein product [Timema podura]